MRVHLCECASDEVCDAVRDGTPRRERPTRAVCVRCDFIQANHGLPYGYAPNHYTLCSPRSSKMEPARALLPITSQTNTLRTHMPYVRLSYAGTVSAEDDPSPLSFAFSASATTAPIITSRTYPYLSKAPASIS